MKPVSFHEHEHIFTLPSNPDVLPLPVLPVQTQDGQHILTSCWKPEFWDIVRILMGKPIYLMIWGGVQPPVTLTTEDLGLENNEL